MPSKTKSIFADDEGAAINTPFTLQELLGSVDSLVHSQFASVQKLGPLPPSFYGSDATSQETNGMGGTENKGKEQITTKREEGLKQKKKDKGNKLAIVEAALEHANMLANSRHHNDRLPFSCSASAAAKVSSPAGTPSTHSTGLLTIERLKQTVDELSWDGAAYFKAHRDPEKVRAERERNKLKWEEERRKLREEEEEKLDGRSAVLGAGKRMRRVESKAQGADKFPASSITMDGVDQNCFKDVVFGKDLGIGGGIVPNLAAINRKKKGVERERSRVHPAVLAAEKAMKEGVIATRTRTLGSISESEDNSFVAAATEQGLKFSEDDEEVDDGGYDIIAAISANNKKKRKKNKGKKKKKKKKRKLNGEGSAIASQAGGEEWSKNTKI